uniref:Uncharacterized protein n=1 Tax=Leersia perrieri TaxID=77586 RepID=A0A0D9WIW0_9ORYZ
MALHVRHLPGSCVTWTADAMKKNNVVLYPCTAVGHLTPMMELAKVFLERGYTVTVALLDDPLNTPIMSANIERVIASHPSVSFYWLRGAVTFSVASDEHFLVSSTSYNTTTSNSVVCSALSLFPRPCTLFTDVLCHQVIDVPRKLGIPVYGFFCSSVGALAIHIQLPSLHAKSKASFGELGDTPLELLGVPPLPASHVPEHLLPHRESKIYKKFMGMCKKALEFDGIMVNTFESLESKMVEALGDSTGILPGRVLLSVYCVRPLVKHGVSAEKHHCLTWLDGQPDHSVVFLCFGSKGTHQQEELKEIAVGLEKSGHRFVCVVQAPRSTNPTKFLEPRTDPDLEVLLPEGFLERTSGRGVIVKLWSPQEDVLRHRATGAFVMHCGWISVLERVTAGVPMLCWPLYAEQGINRVLMVEEMGIALKMHGWQQGLVTAEKVEAKVRLVMESETGNELRARVMAQMEAAAMALTEGSSSHVTFARFLSSKLAMRTKTFVLYPSLGVGHLNPMVELAKHLRRHGLDVIIAVIDPPDNDATSADAVARLAAANPSITFRLLPAPPSSSPDAAVAHPVKRSHDTLRLANPVLREFLLSLPAAAADVTLLLDMFCVDALDVAAELAIPAYFFFASAASALAVFLHLPYYYPDAPSSFRDMGDSLVQFPSAPPIRAVDMLATVQDKESDPTKVRLYQFKRMTEAKGVLVNTFDWLEPKSLKSLAAGVCVPDKPTPRIYSIGPLVDAGKNGVESRHPCVAWLDAQPKRSVVFLCFGSKGAFPAAQLKEIAHGLESSGHRFLWAVRSPPEEQTTSPEPDLELLLPAGFLERTKGKGMVVKNWVPQAEVVRHDAVGAFVTHCGWNSTLEAIMSALPMICWPLYAEQALNKVFMVEEMGIAVALDGYENGGLVKAEEVEAKVRLVMETEEGRKLRERLVETRDMALDAIRDGGSSQVAFDEFMRDLEKNSLDNGACN